MLERQEVGISNDPTASLKAIVVDPIARRVGIGGSDNAISPTYTLDIAGNMRVRGSNAPQQDFLLFLRRRS